MAALDQTAGGTKDTAALDAGVIAWIGDVTGGRVISARLVTSGGRRGYRVDVERPGGSLALFLQRGRKPGEGSFMPQEREAEVMTALAAVGVKTPKVWGVSQSHNVMLMDRLEGAVWFHEPPDEDQRVRIAQDYIVQLARWHSAPVHELDLPTFQPIRSVRLHQDEQLAGIRKLFEHADRQAPIDALSRVTLEYLENNVPQYAGPAVLCQGDTGPGNFLYRGDEVVGVVDWELAHIGDPMDDIAWLSWRATQHGFTNFPQRLAEYERLSGIQVQAERVYYYRVNACARLGPWFGLADMGEGVERKKPAGGEQPDDRAADGSQMVMTTLHRRMRLEALAVALGLEPPSRFVADDAPTNDHTAAYDSALRQLQTMVPLIADSRAVALAKGVARQLKYLREVDRNQGRFDREELGEISRLLGRTVGSLADGRPALAKAARDNKTSFESYFLYHWNRMARDDHLMREASGRLFQRSWPALS